MTTTPRLWNSLTQVNTTDGSKDQFESEITPLQDGGYVVVWTDLSHTYNPQGERHRRPALRFRRQQNGGDPAQVARSISVCSRTATSPRPRSPRWRTATSPWRTPICSPATTTSRCVFSIRRCILSGTDLIELGRPRRSTRRSPRSPTAAMSSPILSDRNPHRGRGADGERRGDDGRAVQSRASSSRQCHAPSKLLASRDAVQRQRRGGLYGHVQRSGHRHQVHDPHSRRQPGERGPGRDRGYDQSRGKPGGCRRAARWRLRRHLERSPPPAAPIFTRRS